MSFRQPDVHQPDRSGRHAAGDDHADPGEDPADPGDEKFDEEFDDLHEPLIGRLSLQAVTLAVAGVFLLVGILGFIPGVTTHLMFRRGPRFSGHDSHAMLFGIFMVSVLHNFVHLAYAAAGTVASFFAATARVYFVAGGLVYLGVFGYGLAVRMDSRANFVPVNDADNWLHLALGVGMILLGIVLHVRLRAVRDAAARRHGTA